MRFLSWLETMRGRITERDTTARRRRTKVPVAGQLEQLEGKALLSVSALFVNGELNVVSDANDNITVGSTGFGASTRVQVLANGLQPAGLQSKIVSTANVAAGTYLVRVQVGDKMATRKVVLL